MSSSAVQNSESANAGPHTNTLLWLHQIDAYALQVAVRANLSITTYGSSGGRLQDYVLKQLDLYNLHADLQRHAMPWQEYLAEYSQTVSAQRFKKLVTDAARFPRELDLVQETLQPTLTHPLCPSASVSGTYGTIHQGPHGWTLHNKDKQTQICSKPWRIVKALFQDGQAPQYLIEVFDNQRWYSATCLQLKLQQRPLQTLNQLCEQLQLTPISCSGPVRLHSVPGCLMSAVASPTYSPSPVFLQLLAICTEAELPSANGVRASVNTCPNFALMLGTFLALHMAVPGNPVLQQADLLDSMTRGDKIVPVNSYC